MFTVVGGNEGVNMFSMVKGDFVEYICTKFRTWFNLNYIQEL